jgi:hypothetical protein
VPFYSVAKYLHRSFNIEPCVLLAEFATTSLQRPAQPDAKTGASAESAGRRRKKGRDPTTTKKKITPQI